MYPVYYFYISVGKSDGTAGGSAAAAANGLTTKSPSFTSANFWFQNDIPAHTLIRSPRLAFTISSEWRLRPPTDRPRLVVSAPNQDSARHGVVRPAPAA